MTWQKRITYRAPKVQADDDSKALENLETQICANCRGQIVFTTGMQPCELDKTGLRENKQNTEHNPESVKQTSNSKTWRSFGIAGQWVNSE